MSAISGAVLFWPRLSYGWLVAQFHHCHLHYDLWIWNEKRRLPNTKMRHRLSRFGLCPHSKISFHSCNSDQIFVFRNNFAQILATQTTHTHLIHYYCVCLLSVKVENVGMCAPADACVSLRIPARSIVGTHLFPNGLVSLNMLVSYCSHSCDSV